MPPPPAPAAEASVRRAAQRFQRRFGRAPEVVARAPGRVNLIGEHVDYEGYDVLPMALAHSVVVAAAAVVSDSGDSDNSALKVTIVNANDAMYDAVVEVTLPSGAGTLLLQRRPEAPRAAWTNYVICGVLGVLDCVNTTAYQTPTVVEMLVDGDIPAGCGLSSSSALVVAAALAFAAAVATPLAIPSRAALAETCRRAEQRVGTLGGGMDQAVACLARDGAALHVSFATHPATATPVVLPLARLGLALVVANSAVVAEKAVVTPTHFNKRVVECALAAKVIGRGCALDAWRQARMSRLVQVQQALEKVSGRPMKPAELRALAETNCRQDAYTREELESVLQVALDELFSDSPAALTVIATAASYRLKQRALHVWSEAERVREFRWACESGDSGSHLGQLMLESHRSLQQLYECSCPELDALVECAMKAGAIGARLTGAGWGGCIVALVGKSRVLDFTARLKLSYYDRRGLLFDAATVFE
ncbi:hypothetical protein PybrP1_000643, partial [[Pythium] brassicae (nom. inval.)]